MRRNKKAPTRKGNRDLKPVVDLVMQGMKEWVEWTPAAAPKPPNQPRRPSPLQAEREVCKALCSDRLNAAKRAALRTQLRKIWAAEAEAKAARPAPGDAERFFAIVDGAPIPLLPIDSTGKPRVADGERFFSLVQAAERSGWKVGQLRDCWNATWGEYMLDNGGAR